MSHHEALDYTPTQPPVANGRIVGGKYRIDALIGSGAMAYVFAATHVPLDQAVALKILRPELLAHPTLVARFASEARAAASIVSEHAARVFDVGALEDGSPFIVMELLSGSDLAQLLAVPRTFAPEAAVGFILQACEALALAHASGIVHRDIKPENLFLAKTVQGPDVIKVLDFGISKVSLTGLLEGRRPLVRTDNPLGSPAYMSPEQVRGASDADARTDVWSIGCVLYELLAGSPAFDAPSMMQLGAAILEQPAPSLRHVRGDVPPALDAVIARCLEKQREDRYADLAALALALGPFADAAAQVSVERCCYVLGKSPLRAAPAEYRAPPAQLGSTTGCALSLRPATIDLVDAAAAGAERTREVYRAPAARRGSAVVIVGSLVALALALAVAGRWMTRRGAPADRAAAMVEPPSNALPAGVVNPTIDSAALPLHANHLITSGAVASARSAAATERSPVVRTERKSKRSQESVKRAPLRAPEPDVGF